MADNNGRKIGAMAFELDSSKLDELVNVYLGTEGVSAVSGQYLMPTVDGGYTAFFHEGVGTKTNTDGTTGVWFMNGFSYDIADVPTDELLDIIGGMKDVSFIVRVFGSRLESNFYNLFRVSKTANEGN